MRLSFSASLYLILWSSLLAVGLPLSWFTARSEVRLLNEDLESRLMAEGAGLASSLFFSMKADDHQAVQQIIATAISREAVAYASAKKYQDSAYYYLERDGLRNGVAHEMFFLIRRFGDGHASIQGAAGGPAPPATAIGREEILGELRLGIFHDEITAKSRQVWVRGFGLAAALVLFVGILLSLGVRSILQRDFKPFFFALQRTTEGASPVPGLSGEPSGSTRKTYSPRDLAEVLSRAADAGTRLATILETMADPLLVFDLKGSMGFVNRATLSTLGYGEEELLRQPMGLIVRDKQFQSSITEGDLAKGPRHVMETTFLTKNGRSIPMLCSLSFLEGGDGEGGDGEGGVLCLAVDMTSWKARENEQQEALAGAERINRELSLLNAKLERKTRETEEMARQAQAATVAKNEFLANMSHEIRTPLNGILGLTDLLLSTQLAPEQRNYLEMVLASGDRLLGIMNDLLDFSRIESKRLQLDEFPFNLRRTLDEALKTLFLKARQKGLDATLAVDGDVPEILVGDQGRFSRIVVNLVRNAVTSTHAGSIHVSVRKEEDLRDGRIVLHVTVRDTGIGVPEEKRGMIFGALVQADSSHVGESMGTGLGLSISSQLVTMMGGRIWFERGDRDASARDSGGGGDGSTFHFTAGFRTGTPLAGDGADRKAAPAVRVAAPAGQERLLHVLLAEDDAINRVLAVTLLESRGWRVTAVENGQQALQAVRHTRFDCVLMDVQMPVMDGYAATKAIRDLERFSEDHLPIVAMTAHALKGDREKCLDAGMDDYIAKPVGADLLFATVERLADAFRPGTGKE